MTVASLQLDASNPRLGSTTLARTPRDIVQYLFDHDKAMEVAESIAERGYFPNEPLLAIQDGAHYVVVEGNRRLAALKALREPAILKDQTKRQIDRLVGRIADRDELSTVPVTIAPSRRATDRQIAGRHIGTPVLAWQAENRASFILAKLTEGYTNASLHAELGFSLADIQQARQTRAIAEMARSIDLPPEVKAKLEQPRAKLFTTLERVFDSSVGREFLRVAPDPDHGLRGTTSRPEFVRGFTKLVSDVALGKQSSRTLNNSEDIRKYFESWKPGELPTKKSASFVPTDIIGSRSPESAGRTSTATAPQRKSMPESKTVLPRDLTVKCDNERIIDIRRELTRLKRAEFPNAGAVLLRVFFEITVVDYLKRTGELTKIISRIEAKSGKIPFGVPTMRQLVPEVVAIAKKHLSEGEAARVEKSLKYDQSAPFTISELHAFVHSSDFPSERDIKQFWLRTEPVFRLMLEQDLEGTKK